MMWTDALKRGGDKKCLVMLEDDGRVRPFTFKDVERESNRMSHFFLSQGLQRGDTVALFMENRPEFVISWLGMTKIGVKVAMINTSIKEKGLLHCIKISGCKLVLFGTELGDVIKDIWQQLNVETANLKVFSKEGTVDFCPSADPLVAASKTDRPPASLIAGIRMSDVFGFIYTSGTTGLPKAAVILHQKVFSFGALMGRAFVVQESDVVYTVLPLFHSAGGGLGIGMMMYRGCTVVLRKKFSAKLFFQDCSKHNITVVQYIGELCRYLLATPPSEFDKKHKVRIAIGNGLRPEIWDAFQTRFNIPEIGEFYGATEGNAALVNHCRTKDAQGACGRQGLLAQKIMKNRFARFDVENEAVIRGPDGFCQDCAVGEPGELLFPILDNDPSTTFAGYEDPKATAKKIIRDAFVKGDKYFMTGDLLNIDAKGFIRFVDRIGDTFRWKGENCSTTEVSEVLSTFPGILEPNVYGVLIPNNQDGRAPCASIIPVDGKIENIDMVKLVSHLKKHLPAYAVPLFLRISPQMEMTATMKQTKGQLRTEGMDISKVQDPLFFLDGDKFVPLTKQVYAKITTPGARL
jgi:acyl-CoA synthetase (AMP-forming)/AMP-acid ligase II